ncbi:shikimate dehydrogenase family protein [Aureivirga sp. CE67]|uniref:shikimate dehydrogenase family protein n=1 Tax=Aureivirga sp. CE67 TaxID=1788983 RepID=UPI0018CBCE21|nr:shikimate dehydrogenase [Aureivirga sp. CE67]
MKLLGLVGRNISYSFSRGYFKEKFEKLHLENDFSYRNFDIEQIELFPSIIEENKKLVGCNVTIPYKQEIIPYLDALDEVSKEIGAVNTIKVKDGKLFGFNTDAYGFENSIKPLIKNQKKALILGTGGASKAVVFALNKMGISHKFVSRNKSENNFIYEEIDQKIMEEFEIIINCTPIGTFPNIEEKPNLPYKYLTENHLLYDLVYNPEETAFLKEGKSKNSIIKNGHDMLILQAEKSWEIWNQ